MLDTFNKDLIRKEEARRYLVECRKLMWAAVNEWTAANHMGATDAEAKQVAHDNLYETENAFCNAFIHFHNLADFDVE